ncbi:uncharacterized protein LOC111028596 [Myzus persicae]|uniref:uncharacterized protein LOC111028596 n=1 Tax=Myzus persicae TaxID=13164 RepID=UPI000B932AA8|nr:uncharacterized protein LOC111028596 [Myzus persicae]
MCNTKSDVFLFISGVPQGGHLSPLLFSFFVNSARTSLKHSQLLCFADDLNILLRIYSVDDCLKLQDDLNSFFSWAEDLGLTLHVNKCRSIVFTIDSTICDLGFSFTFSHCPRAHIDKITCKALKG